MCCTERHSGVWLAPYADHQRSYRRPDRHLPVPVGYCERLAAAPADFACAQLTRRGQLAMADRASTQLLNITHREFGRRLRDERERRGLMLQAIADSTKIPFSLLAALERGDIEDWPSGLFGRAHVRAYAAAVGLSPEPLIDRVPPAAWGRRRAPAQAPYASTPDDGLRLTLAEDRRWDIRAIGRRRSR